MGVAELRKSLHHIIDHADEKFLRMVNSLANEYTKEDNKVVYRAGKAISKKDLYLELKKSDKEIDEGNYLTIEDFSKESEKWD